LYAPWQKKTTDIVQQNAEAMNDHLCWKAGNSYDLEIILYNPLQVCIVITRVQLVSEGQIKVEERQSFQMMPGK
jgi:hypothetical protein